MSTVGLERGSPQNDQQFINMQKNNSEDENNPNLHKSFYQIMRDRFSSRQFKKQSVEDEKIQRILNNIRYAPSAGNLQAFHVAIVKDPHKLRSLAQVANNQLWIAQADCAMIFIALKEKSANKYLERGHELYAIQDATIACTYAQLACQAEGLGSCWVGAFSDKNVSKIVQIDQKLGESQPVAILVIGYDNEPKSARRDRMKVSEMCTYVQ